MSLVELSRLPDGLCALSLNDAPRRNAMGMQMAIDFRDAVERLRADATLRILLITGKGTAFSAGGDLEMLRDKASRSREQNQADMLDFYDAFLCVLQLEVPLIAAINGHAIGAGACLAMACDYRVAAEEARIGFTFTRLALHPGMGATLTLPRLSGIGVASDLLMSGRIVQANEAKQLGLVNAIVSTDQVVEAAVDYAGQLQLCGPLALRGLLQTLRPNPEALRAALQREATEQAANYASLEFREGITAALERRVPRFKT